uniref:Uncharacterized protein n=1 Tax=Plectus sambesii TaxID=2011161 RepID=A0A914UL89_9BILA
MGNAAGNAAIGASAVIDRCSSIRRLIGALPAAIDRTSKRPLQHVCVCATAATLFVLCPLPSGPTGSRPSWFGRSPTSPSLSRPLSFSLRAPPPPTCFRRAHRGGDGRRRLRAGKGEPRSVVGRGANNSTSPITVAWQKQRSSELTMQ